MISDRFSEPVQVTQALDLGAQAVEGHGLSQTGRVLWDVSDAVGKADRIEAFGAGSCGRCARRPGRSEGRLRGTRHGHGLRRRLLPGVDLGALFGGEPGRCLLRDLLELVALVALVGRDGADAAALMPCEVA
jgi:hypothetical protein